MAGFGLDADHLPKGCPVTPLADVEAAFAAAGLEPVGVIAELVHDDGSMMRLPALREFADLWNIPLVSIEDLAAWRAS